MGMRYHVLAADYDGTLATDGRVDAETLAALERLRASGRCLVLVTGRIFSDLAQLFPRTDLFDAIVAENGATLWRPGNGERNLAQPPPAVFVHALRDRGVPFSQGHVVVATSEPHEAAVLRAVEELGLELQVIRNKGAVMVLPANVDKETGLEAALAELGLAVEQAVAVGDAENDEPMLASAGMGVAVANALPSVKLGADLVTVGAAGAGVAEVVARLLAGDLGGAR
jgi:hydroxymethylpyrimidine pyrophosphatase-like HAD family hydrolase